MYPLTKHHVPFLQGLRARLSYVWNALLVGLNIMNAELVKNINKNTNAKQLKYLLNKPSSANQGGKHTVHW